jgi:PTS system mannose-specific IID component
MAAVVGGYAGVAVAVGIYNIIHLSLRYGLYQAGYREGDAIVEVVARKKLPVFADQLRHAGGVLCGLFAAAILFRSASSAGAGGVFAVAFAVLGGYFALVRGARLLPTAYAITLLGIGFALVAVHWQGGS